MYSAEIYPSLKARHVDWLYSLEINTFLYNVKVLCPHICLRLTFYTRACLLKPNRSSDSVGKKRLLGEVTPWNFSDTYPVIINELTTFWEHIMKGWGTWKWVNTWNFEQREWNLLSQEERKCHKSGALPAVLTQHVCLSCQFRKASFLWLHLQKVPITVPGELPCWKCELAGPSGDPSLPFIGTVSEFAGSLHQLPGVRTAWGDGGSTHCPPASCRPLLHWCFPAGCRPLLHRCFCLEGPSSGVPSASPASVCLSGCTLAPPLGSPPWFLPLISS